MIRTIVALLGACVVAVYLAQTLNEVSENARVVASRELNRGKSHVISIIRDLTRLQPSADIVQAPGDKTGENKTPASHPQSVEQAGAVSDRTARPDESGIFGRNSNRLIVLDACCLLLVERWLNDGACVVSWDEPVAAAGDALQVAVDVRSTFGARLADAAVPFGARGRKMFLSFPRLNGRTIDETSATARLTCSLTGEPTISAADVGL